MATNLNKLFVFVPSASVATFKSTTGKNDSYKNKIAFLQGTGEIMTQGEVFALNRESDIDALKTKIGKSGSDFKALDASLNAEDIISAINTLKGLVDTNTTNIGNATSGLTKRVADLETSVDTASTGLKDRMTTVEGKVNTLVGEDANKSVRAISAEEVAKIVASAPESFDTLKEIADWIGSGDVASTTAASMLADINTLKTNVGAANTAESGQPSNATGIYASIDNLQEQITSMSGGAGSIATQINNKVETLDASVTLAGTTASQPGTVARNTSIDVLGSITVSETDGKLDAEAAGKSAKVVLQADAAGAAQKAYEDLLGTNADGKTVNTIYGVKAYVDDAVASKNVSATGETGADALVTASASNNAVTIASTTKLQQAVQLAETALQKVVIASTDTDLLAVSAQGTGSDRGATLDIKTGTLSTGTTTALTADTTNGKLATVDNVAEAINGIEVWETFSA